MNILGIETSCDETSAAVVRDGRHVLSSVVFSQVDLHRPYGGVVPEVASRNHVVTLPGVIEEAMAKSGLAWDAIDAVAVTYGPGLASSLLVGLSAAKGLALRLGKPLRGMNHIEAHLCSVFLDDDAPLPETVTPFTGLVVSGGHTCLVRVDGIGNYRILGQTVDDAAGEAFDKGAKLLGLGFPGGPAIDKAAKGVTPCAVKFPLGRQKKDRDSIAGMDPALCFSFSGLKTALLYYLREHPVAGDAAATAAVAASYQDAIVDALVRRCKLALRGTRCLAVGGGVSLNSSLRAKLQTLADDLGVRLLLAKPRYCADNAAMVAGLAGMGRGICGEAALDLDCDPNLPLVEPGIRTIQ
jgi:N6-L-threonylcarbamoyladenine synthase